MVTNTQVRAILKDGSFEAMLSPQERTLFRNLRAIKSPSYQEDIDGIIEMLVENYEQYQQAVAANDEVRIANCQRNIDHIVSGAVGLTNIGKSEVIGMLSDILGGILGVAASVAVQSLVTGTKNKFGI